MTVRIYPAPQTPGNVSAAMVFAEHNADCKVCCGDEQVRLLVVRPRELGGPATADQIGSVIVCPLLPRLPDLFFAVPRGGGPRAST